MNTEHFQSLLETEKLRLETELATVGRRNPSNQNDWEPLPQATGQESDLGDVAELISGYEDNTAILKDLEIRYNHILAALSRITDGTYGMCEVCEEAIEEARLAADPAARTCLAHL
jgi:RNA polymerase-binding transcription factor DksA